MTASSPKPDLFESLQLLRAELFRLIRFGLVGLLGAATYVAGTIMLTHLGVWQVAASITAHIAAGLVYYFGQGRFTFEVEVRRVSRASRFVILVLGSLAFNGFATAALLHGFDLPPHLVVAIVTVLMPLVSYPISRFWVFA